MTVVDAYAVKEQGGNFEKFTYELPAIGEEDIDIEVKHVGICHSDLSMAKNEWGMTSYPFVGGHEGAGIVKAVGSSIKHVVPGDRVGLGWHAGYCNTCNNCTSGDHNLCKNSEPTIVGRHGSFGRIVRAKGISVIKIPDALDLADVGPLFCGGVTVFNPLVQYNITPLSKVAVVGIGGLGHLALMFLRAWGCHVTAFTSNPEKAEECLKLGAHDTLNSRKPEEFEAHKGEYDLILVTVNVKLDWDAYLSLLAPKGRLHFLGAQQSVELPVFPMLFSQLSTSSSPVGSPVVIRKMLEFCARHNIKPKTEHFPVEQINEAITHLEEGKARYRIVLDF